MMRLSTTAAMLCLFFSFTAPAGEITPRLEAAIDSQGESAIIVAWVFFRDKGSFEYLRDAVPRNLVSERSLNRRLKVRSSAEVVDYSDLPVEEQYVRSVALLVHELRQRSKWMNAVSVAATPEQLRRVAELPCVATLDPVARFRKDTSERETGDIPLRLPATAPTLLDYGPSFAQVDQIGVPAVHNTGNYAQGVVVGVFDNGFRLPGHESFTQMEIIATYDFVDHKVSVVPNNPASDFGAHGVNTLSTIGGYRPGQLIGPAFGASFILARTENDSSETPIEEDYWLAAIEWADSIGVDVTSTSLGYLDYTFPYTSWTWEDMDGNTTVITRAADMAAGRGILVFNSAGNEGSNPSHNTLIAPADGDSVVAVGAVGSSGTRVSFSSIGPTTSIPPRIKPDIMARGSGVVVASAVNPTGYTTASGTSFSCPLAAGVGALVLKAHPTASPMQILAALKATAGNSASPNNLMGWGIINAQAAIDYLTASSVPGTEETPVAHTLDQNYPNPFNPSTTIRFSLAASSFVRLTVYDLLGREIRTLLEGFFPAGSHTAQWDGCDSGGRNVTGGVYLYRLTAGSGPSQARTMLLLK